MAKQLAQIFPVAGAYVPTKASAYLRPYLNDPSTSWLIGDSVNSVVIDATNFSSLTQRDHYFTYSEYVGYTGPGCMSVETLIPVGDAITFPDISFPISSTSIGSKAIWIRGHVPALNRFKGRVLLDGQLQRSFDLAPDGGAGFSWRETSVDLTDTNEHILSLHMQDTGIRLDKIILGTPNPDPPVGNGPALTDSPYITIHALLYDLAVGVPSTSVGGYDYKTSFDEELLSPGWYNFDVSRTDTPVYADNNYAFVLVPSGTRDENFVIWNTTDYVSPLYMAENEL